MHVKVDEKEQLSKDRKLEIDRLKALEILWKRRGEYGLFLMLDKAVRTADRIYRNHRNMHICLLG